VPHGAQQGQHHEEHDFESAVSNSPPPPPPPPNPCLVYAAHMLSTGGVTALIGSRNPQKAEAVRRGFSSVLPPETPVSVLPCDAVVDGGITEWRAACAPGQPFGLAQTRCGALNRMAGCTAHAASVVGPVGPLDGGRVFAVGRKCPAVSCSILKPVGHVHTLTYTHTHSPLMFACSPGRC
jgi:hypothetical protein